MAGPVGKHNAQFYGEAAGFHLKVSLMELLGWQIAGFFQCIQHTGVYIRAYMGAVIDDAVNRTPGYPCLVGDHLDGRSFFHGGFVPYYLEIFKTHSSLSQNGCMCNCII